MSSVGFTRNYVLSVGHALMFAVSAFILLKVLPVGRDFCEVSFSLAYSEPGENHCQVFYVDGTDDGLVELPRHALSGSGTFSFRLPCRSLNMLRIDFGSIPGEIRMSDFQCRGECELLSGKCVFKSTNIESFRANGNTIEGRSSHIDPFVEITPAAPIPARADRVFGCVRICIAVAVFIVVCVTLTTRRDGRI